MPPVDSSGNYTYTPGIPFAPASPVWSYSATGFYSNHLGGNQRLPNGNTIISESTSGNLFEVTSSGSVVWNFSPGWQIVRVLRYGHDYPGLSNLVGIEENNVNSIPKNFDLSQNYPNPFNPATIIKYELPVSANISLKVYDILGNEIRTLENNSDKNAGSYSVEWNGKDDRGVEVSSGVYFYKLMTADYNKTMRMILMK